MSRFVCCADERVPGQFEVAVNLIRGPGHKKRWDGKSETVAISREYHKAGRKQKQGHTPMATYFNMVSDGKELHN